MEESHELTLNDLPKATYYAMGHIHTAKAYEYDGKHIVYPGCPERFDTKEASLAITFTDELHKKEGAEKGFFIVEDFVPRFVRVTPRNLVNAYIEASNAGEAEERLLEVLKFAGSEDLFLASIVSEASVDIANLTEIASKSALFARLDYKPLRKTFERVRITAENEFFTDFELQLLEYLKGSLDESELHAAVEAAKEHFGLAGEKEESRVVEAEKNP